MKNQEHSRFWSKVDRSGECWIWRACRFEAGYGQFCVSGKMVRAHRYAYELENGPIPDGMFACHRCDNPPCCNPAHIFLGTNADNVADRNAKGRQATCGGRGERHCCAKLTEAQVKEIRAAYAAGGVLQRELGVRFGVSQRQISYIVRGTWWKEDRK